MCAVGWANCVNLKSVATHACDWAVCGRARPGQRDREISSEGGVRTFIDIKVSLGRRHGETLRARVGVSAKGTVWYSRCSLEGEGLKHVVARRGMCERAVWVRT